MNTFQTGDRVRHVDHEGAVGTVVRVVESDLVRGGAYVEVTWDGVWGQMATHGNAADRLVKI